MPALEAEDLADDRRMPAGLAARRALARRRWRSMSWRSGGSPSGSRPGRRRCSPPDGRSPEFVRAAGPRVSAGRIAAATARPGARGGWPIGGTGAPGVARRGVDPHPGRSGPGCDRRSRDGQGPGAASGRPGRPLRGAQHARRRAAAAGAAAAARRRAEPSPPLPQADYLSRARLAAMDAARRNGVDPARLRTVLSGRRGRPAASGARHGDRRDRSGASSRAANACRRSPADPGGRVGASPRRRPRCAPGRECRRMAEGGGYSGPLVYRDGEGMRPDVAAAYDRMGAAARRAGIDLVVVSGFRSDAEQAELFARHPDPRWVAPPGHSLHRCATELDLGPSSRLRMARRERPPLRLHPAVFLGALALRLRRRARRPARRPATGSWPVGSSERRRGSAAARGSRTSSRRSTGRRCCARRRTGTSHPACSPRS